MLPDVLGPGLAIVFCGTRAGTRSAELGVYYAGPGNKFWPTLARVGLVDPKFERSDFPTLVARGIGFTDLCKASAGADATIDPTGFDVASFEAKIHGCQPRILAFNGKKAAAVALRTRTTVLEYGRQSVRIAGAMVHVLPSTSGAASGYWSIEPWRQLAKESGLAP